MGLSRYERRKQSRKDQAEEQGLGEKLRQEG